MGYFQVRYDSRVVIFERKMFLILATGVGACSNVRGKLILNIFKFWLKLPECKSQDGLIDKIELLIDVEF